MSPRLTATLEEAWDSEGDQAQIFGRVVDIVEQAWPLEYMAFVEWNENGVGGSIQLERGTEGPAETSLISWLLREAESGAGVVVGTGADLPGVGVALAVPLRFGNSELVGFLVLSGTRAAAQAPPPRARGVPRSRSGSPSPRLPRLSCFAGCR